MNIPNILTLTRIILVPAIVISLIQGKFINALIMFCMAGITDGLDGFLARVLDEKTTLGSYLDPLADKALVASSFITLSILGVIPPWVTVLVISRDLIILIGISVLFLLSVSFDVKPTFVSKATTAAQFLTVFLVLVHKCVPGFIQHQIVDGLFIITALLTVISGFLYIYIGTTFINGSGREGN